MRQHPMNRRRHHRGTSHWRRTSQARRHAARRTHRTLWCRRVNLHPSVQRRGRTGERVPRRIMRGECGDNREDEDDEERYGIHQSRSPGPRSDATRREHPHCSGIRSGRTRPHRGKRRRRRTETSLRECGRCRPETSREAFRRKRECAETAHRVARRIPSRPAFSPTKRSPSHRGRRRERFPPLTSRGANARAWGASECVSV
jgi:hypothetical protein